MPIDLVTGFATNADARAYVELQGYVFDRHEPWAFTAGLDFFVFAADSKKRCGIKESTTERGTWAVVYYQH